MGSVQSLIQGDAFKVSIIFFFIGSLIMILFGKLRKLFTKNKKKAILYILIILVSFALVGLLSSSKVFNDTPINSFVGVQSLFLILGAVHVYVLRTFFEDFQEDKTDFFKEFLFTVAILCIGLIALFNVVSYFKESFKFYFLSAGVAFLIPFLFYKLYEFAYLIPVPVYKKWFYPLGNIKDPTATELENPLVISFEFKKERSKNDITNFRVKAPQSMEFGKLFYFFLNDYNERHPESKIECFDENEKNPLGWVFHYKPHWWNTLQHINFQKTVDGNGLRENHVVICQRVDDDNYIADKK